MSSLVQALLSSLGFDDEVLERKDLLSPLGNRPEDVEAWNKFHQDKPEREELSQKERYARANKKRRADKKWLWFGIFLMAKSYFSGENPIKSINQVIDWAMAKRGKSYKSSASIASLRKYVKACLDSEGINYLGMMVSSRSLQIWWKIINMVAKHYRKGGNRKIDDALNWAIEKVGIKIKKDDKTKLKRMLLHILRQRGIDWEVASGLESAKFLKPLGPTIEGIKTSRKSNTASRGNGNNSIKKRWDLVGALMNGRKKKFGFGRYWNRNDEDWVTLVSLHYDNCKVAFRPKLLGRTIYNLLLWGAQKEDIICQYGILLHYYHGLAVDTETAVWEPTKLVHDLRNRVFEKMGM